MGKTVVFQGTIYLSPKKLEDFKLDQNGTSRRIDSVVTLQFCSHNRARFVPTISPKSQRTLNNGTLRLLKIVALLGHRIIILTPSLPFYTLVSSMYIH